MKNVAVVGSGYWGKNLVRNAHKLGLLHTVCDPNDKARSSVAAAYPGIRCVKTFAEVIDDTAINGVIIATPASTHYELVKQALNAGKHVMVEKPFTETAGQAEELVTLAERRKLVLMVGFTFLYNTAVRKVKSLIDSGELGDIRYIYSQRLNLGIVRKDVDVWWNLAPHDISIINYWLGDQPVSAGGSGVSFIQPGIADVVTSTIRYRSGAAAFIHVSWIDPGKIRRMTVVGSKKMVVYDDADPDMKVQIFDKGVDKFEDFNTFGQFQLIHRAGDIHIPKIDFDEPLAVECAHFAECIGTGAEPLTSGRNALPVVRVLEAVATSMKNNSALEPIT